MGVEYQHVKFSTLQPAWSRGAFHYSGNFTDIPKPRQHERRYGPDAAASNGRACHNRGQCRIRMASAIRAAPTTLYASNINKTYDEKMYFAAYFQDDWKMTPKLTFNLGLRWDYFGPINETNGGQANFVPIALPEKGIGGPTFIIPATGKDNRSLSTTGSMLRYRLHGLRQSPGPGWHQPDSRPNKYGKGFLQTQKTNLLPALGLPIKSSGNG